jgi:tRNA-specific 2-thiouridylase
MKKRSVAVGLSGGVDSAVTAALLLEKGFDVKGVTMSTWDGAIDIEDITKKGCYGPNKDKDIEDARNIAKQLGIPFAEIDMRKEFREEVISYFRYEYLNGRTPNPCIICNRQLKFGAFLEKAALELDFDFFATGHYSRIVKENGSFFMRKAVDASKDQTYFLQSLKKENLHKILFPLGEMYKKDVRKKAIELGLEVAERPESQDFITGGDYSLLFNENDALPGDIVNEDGKVLGRHHGIIHYTIGQRKGLGISNPVPLYVIKVDPILNQVVVTEKANLFSTEFYAGYLNSFFDGEMPKEFRAMAKIRQKHKESPATIRVINNEKIQVIFDEPQLSITPGQAVAIFNDDLLLCGGIIL